MHLDFGIFILLLALLVLGYWFNLKRAAQFPALPVSIMEPFIQKRGWRVYLSQLSAWSFWLAMFFLVVAMSNPRKVEDIGRPHSLVKSEVPRSGVALYFVLDESGSMSEKVPSYNDRGSRIELAKIDLAKQAIMEFVEGNTALSLPGRKNDLVGLISFARVPEVLCPLTLDRVEIATKLESVSPIKDDNRNGTAIGYAIFKAVNIIVATKHFADRQEEAHKGVYSIKNQAIIVITDGLQSPNPADRDNPFRFMPAEEAIGYANDNGIRVFYIGIDPILAKSDYAADISDMKKVMKAGGGDLFLATGQATIEDILSQIDTLEKSELPPQSVLREKPIRETSLVGVFVMAAMIALAAGVMLETTFVRSIP